MKRMIEQQFWKSKPVFRISKVSLRHPKSPCWEAKCKGETISISVFIVVIAICEDGDGVDCVPRIWALGKDVGKAVAVKHPLSAPIPARATSASPCIVAFPLCCAIKTSKRYRMSFEI